MRSEYNDLIRKYIPLETIPAGTIRNVFEHLKNNTTLMSAGLEDITPGRKLLNLKYVDFGNTNFDNSQIISIDMNETIEFEEGKPFEIGRFENLSGTIIKKESIEEIRIEIIKGEVRKIEKGWFVYHFPSEKL